MSSIFRKQPLSKLESNSSDWESLKLWSTNDSSGKLTHLIEREALSATVQQREAKSSTKTFLFPIFGLTLCLILYGLGLITLSKNIHSFTQEQDSNPNNIELELGQADDFR